MKNYPFLEDELAVTEIRKHKWIESEKKGHEIGFATAALDWIKKYGQAWQQFRLRLKTQQNILDEKRLHRRFHQQFPITIHINDTAITAQTDEISLIGVACTIPTYVPYNTSTKIEIHFNKNQKKNPSRFQFQSRIARIAKSTENKRPGLFSIFIPFPEEVRDYIRLNSNVLVID